MVIVSLGSFPSLLAKKSICPCLHIVALTIDIPKYGKSHIRNYTTICLKNRSRNQTTQKFDFLVRTTYENNWYSVLYVCLNTVKSPNSRHALNNG